MSQDTAFGKADATAHIKVQKADGRVLYYRVSDDQNTEITQDEYEKGIG